MKNKDIYKYDGGAKISFDTERFIQYCEKVQKLIYEHNELFEGFENDLIYVIDVATNHLLYDMQRDYEKEHLDEFRKTTQAYINALKDAFLEDEGMKKEYEKEIEYLEAEIERKKNNGTETTDFYRMKIADLDCILQWYGY